ncbi:nuclear transport factor 2 family protein [Amycolatopsis nivea]
MTDPKTALRRFLAIVNSHDLAELDTVVAEDVTESGPVVVDAPTGGLAAFRIGWTQMLTAFPDLRVDVDALLAEDDRVAATVTLTATNTPATTAEASRPAKAERGAVSSWRG